MKTPRARADVVLRPVGRDWVLYDPRTRDLHLLNITAALTWDLLDGTLTEAEIVGQIRELVREAPPAPVVEEDVRGAIRDFDQKGLLA
ncbi:MAG: PqqD family protein [Longimicrobiales bacterium]|nr:PqqD family protein [Longimicrobiales bacterium]